MKKFGLILLIVAVSFSAYLVWSYFASSTSDTLVVPANRAGNDKPSTAGKDIKSLQGDFINSVKEKIGAAKSFVEQIPQAANDAFNDLVAQTKDTAKEKLIDILETTSSPASAPISVNPGTVSGTSQNPSTEPNVCFVVSKGTLVGYGIDQPFPDMEETSYKLDWGDGKTINGLFHSGDKNIVVSHSYAELGTYSVVFQLTNSSTILTASRSVCVK